LKLYDPEEIYSAYTCQLVGGIRSAKNTKKCPRFLAIDAYFQLRISKKYTVVTVRRHNKGRSELCIASPYQSTISKTFIEYEISQG
jgi:hypothetical protein